MKPLFATLPLVLAAACASPAPRPAETPAMAECRAEAERSPGAQAMFSRMNLDNVNNRDRVEREREQIVNRAYADCLTRRGIVRGGGVEPVRRSGF
ncbi:hypothetical protein [Falsiroseomonas stagni]|uniref:Uncharacterized protein n=1 Tax=Falsiroseomonas stagni DSM 19981 TaxID=1123062 RepID=A0A1I3XIP9_9PROT|nr:hypothetical protein [Falsiroseomonas stagni]SFK19413.1 hypothetical protein SAMN02745775_101356 [Falsiroseomonas stagni DSM 19981]